MFEMTRMLIFIEHKTQIKLETKKCISIFKILNKVFGCDLPGEFRAN